MPLADCSCIVFLRTPVSGTVKTRIAATLGDKEALAIYNELASITLRLASSLNMPVYLFYEGGLPSVMDPAFQYREQAEGDLGKKMESAIHSILEKHKKVLIIGSDCPKITGKDLYEACQLLDGFDFVLGPAEDGGFYMMGCKKWIPSLFDNIPWSTSTVLDQIKERILKSGKSFYQLRTLPDIDTEADWIRYKASHS
jgi:rSAM/selenodomain-associated transferase 1